MEYDVSNRCRACLAESEVMFPLFENYENNLTLSDIIEYFLKLQVNLHDNLPKKICQECATLLIQFYNFSITFEENNKKLINGIGSNIEYNKNFFHQKQFREEYNEKQDVPVTDDVYIIDKEKTNLIKDERDFENNKFSDRSNKKEKNIEKLGVKDCDNYEEIIICTTNNETNYDSDVVAHKCNVCDKHFKNVLLLKKHLQLHIQNKKFICEVCGYVSLKKSYLIDHMEMHTADKPYSCNFCGKTFRRRSIFSRHKKIHTNPKQIVCEMCGQKFTDRGTLKTHILLLHIKSRNFKCIVCNQTFPLKATLEKHLRRHQQKGGTTKNFSCTECNMQYFDKSSLKRHYITKHSDENVKVKCQFCCKEYTSKTNLHKHVKVHHKEKCVHFKLTH